MIIEAVYTLAAQLLLGAACAGIVGRLMSPRGAARRRWLGWNDASRALRRAAPWALGLALVAMLARLRLAAPSGPLDGPAIWIHPWRFLLTGALATTSCFLVLHAASRERRGRLRAARREVRPAGLLLFPGILGLLILVWADLLFQPVFRRALLRDAPGAGLFLLAGIVFIGCGAFVGVLAGLSGKARPSAYFTALFYLLGLLGLMQAGHLALVECRRSVKSTIACAAAPPPVAPGARLDALRAAATSGFITVSESCKGPVCKATRRF